MRIWKLGGLSGLCAGAFGALLLLPATAFAASATASASANVRSGPGTAYNVLGKLRAGETVDITQCKGSFCYVTHNGTPGWVSASFLTRGIVASTGDVTSDGGPAPDDAPPGQAVTAPAVAPDFDAPGLPPANIPAGPPDAFGTGYGFGADDPGHFDRFRLRSGDFGPPRSFDRPDQACFFEDSNFDGNRFCLGQGESRNNLQSGYGPISSIRNPVGLRITVCDDFRHCQVFSTSVPNLSVFGDQITSITVN